MTGKRNLEKRDKDRKTDFTTVWRDLLRKRKAFCRFKVFIHQSEDFTKRLKLRSNDRDDNGACPSKTEGKTCSLFVFY